VESRASNGIGRRGAIQDGGDDEQGDDPVGETRVWIQEDVGWALYRRSGKSVVYWIDVSP
jgi:hypothetical protein